MILLERFSAHDELGMCTPVRAPGTKRTPATQSVHCNLLLYTRLLQCMSTHGVAHVSQGSA